LVLYLGSYLFFKLQYPAQTVAIIYMTVTGVGFLLILAGGNLLSRLIKYNLGDDVFNSLNETFPQEERFISNEYSINLPARYNLK
ncbi:YWFCY domain-containing protein, partial [Acinetobacter baumannii]|uniref:YWFCY domain-containing protein n=1 Tax=Acinetobacter baumannii TaxID=470 RepID=UPI003993EFF6